jgi:hypothetical protein
MTKHNFINIINALEAQYKYDELHSKSLAKVLGLEEGSMYNNGSLVDCMISVMAFGFNDSKRAEESIRHFMYDDGFGKENSPRSFTVEDLWDNLHSTCIYRQQMSEPDRNKINTTQAIFLNIDKLIKMHQDNSSYNELSNIVLALKINIDVLRNFSSNSDKEFFLVDTNHKIEPKEHVSNFHYESNTSQINQLNNADNT